MSNYVKVAKDDHRLFANVLWQARGDMSINDFAFTCGGTPRNYCLYAYEKVTKCIPDKMAVSVAKNAPAVKGFSEESLMAVVGKLNQELLYAIFYQYMNEVFKNEMKKRCPKASDVTKKRRPEAPDVILMSFQDGQLCSLVPNADAPGKRKYIKKPEAEFNREEYIQQLNLQMTDNEKEAMKYLSYINDLSFFSLTLSDAEIIHIKRNIHSIYRSRTVVRMLNNFHKTMIDYEKEKIDKLILYFKGSNAENVPDIPDRISSLYRMLKDLL